MGGVGATYKRCPRCGLTAGPDAEECVECGHGFMPPLPPAAPKPARADHRWLWLLAMLPLSCIFLFVASLFIDDSPDELAGVWVNEFLTITLEADGNMTDSLGGYSRWRVSGPDGMYFSGSRGEVCYIYAYNEQAGVLMLASVDPEAISVFQRVNDHDPSQIN